MSSRNKDNEKKSKNDQHGTIRQGLDSASIDPRLAQVQTRRPPPKQYVPSSKDHSQPSSKPSRSHYAPSAAGTMLQGRDKASVDPRLAQAQTQRPPPKQSARPSKPSHPHYAPSNAGTELQDRDQQNSIDPRLAQAQSQRPPEATVVSVRPASLAPIPTAASTFVTDRDTNMASRQLQFDSMEGAERAEQEVWAYDQLSKNSGNCDAGFRWIRIPGGYMCEGEAHFVPDELLAEGKGGFRERAFQWGPYFGPFYGHENVRLIMREIMHDVRYMGLHPFTGVNSRTGRGPGRNHGLWYGGAVAGLPPWEGVDWIGI